MTAAFHGLDEATFDAALAHPGLTVVDVWADGCVSCKQLGRLLEQLAPELPAGVQVATLNISTNPALADRFEVRSVPTLLFFKNGVLVERRHGVDRRQVIKKAIETHA